ncbi:ATP-binding protein [Roseburia hominis]
MQVSNMVRDAIKPDLTMFLHYETLTVDGKKIVAVDIQQGMERPYYIAKKGLRPEGVYVRQGYSSVPSTNTAIRHMIKETDGDHFEERRSLEQNLTFEKAGKEFADRKEFAGSLFQQMDDVYDFIDFCNQTHSTFDKLRRIDRRDYPEVAVREALLNLLVHREYSFRASIFISIYTDRIEFTSIGGLVSGVTLKDLTMGISVCRNAKLANVFYRLELIEASGTGILKIMDAYEGTGMTPQIETSDNAFKIILPNLNAKTEQKEVKNAGSVVICSTFLVYSNTPVFSCPRLSVPVIAL